LIEDAWEELGHKANGDVILDSYPAWICKNRCGYIRRLEVQTENAAALEQIVCTVDHKYSNPKIPNLFHFATSELSQDAFLCWLISWADRSLESVNQPMHGTANEFIKMVLKKFHLPIVDVETIEIKRQFKGLDILVIINDRFAMLIEDKTFTKNHSNQLTRYRQAVEKGYPELVQLPIYYKIADQSHYKSVIESGFIPFTRHDILELTEKGRSIGANHPLFLDYAEHIRDIEARIQAYQTKPVEDWDSYAWQGFYMELQKHFVGNWGYVPNQAGGFWGMWWDYKRNTNYFIVLEEKKLCLKIRVKPDEHKATARNKALEEMLSESEKHDLHLERPARMGSGLTMTVAQRTNYIQVNVDGIVNILGTVAELKKY